MPLSAYQQALADAKTDTPPKVEGVFKAWSADAVLGQVTQNVADETAFASADFTSLLDAFAQQLAIGSSPLDSWLAACRAHKLKGRRMPDVDCPVILGRARGLDDHASVVAQASRGALTKGEAKNLLLKYADSVSLGGFESFLRDAPLGKYLIWANFFPSMSSANPFDKIPFDHTSICTALGLGHFTVSDTLIILIWNHVACGSPSLHRPTVADAEAYPYYRPWPDPHAPWGLTKPLSPNPSGLPPQPELVMPETSSKGLKLPYRVI